MNVLVVIPSRFGSSRLPGKPLKLIGGKPMVQRVYEQVSNVSDIVEVVVATDDSRIEEVVNSFGGNCKMTSVDHKTGTDRCIEVLESYSDPNNFDLVINVQGDEPFVQEDQLLSIIDLFKDPSVEIATLKKKLENDSAIIDPNTVKVVTDQNSKALYFSRAAIPHYRGRKEGAWSDSNNYYKHIGIYGFRSSVLLKIKSMKGSEIEEMESLEQLRWLDNGCTIAVAETDFQSPSVDTEEDLVSVENFLKKHPEFL